MQRQPCPEKCVDDFVHSKGLRSNLVIEIIFKHSFKSDSKNEIFNAYIMACQQQFSIVK